MLCDKCLEEEAVVFCDHCSEYFCSLGGCDKAFHVGKFARHNRYRIGARLKQQVYQSSIQEAPGEASTTTDIIVPGGLETYTETAAEQRARELKVQRDKEIAEEEDEIRAEIEKVKQEQVKLAGVYDKNVQLQEAFLDRQKQSAVVQLEQFIAELTQDEKQATYQQALELAMIEERCKAMELEIDNESQQLEKEFEVQRLRSQCEMLTAELKELKETTVSKELYEATAKELEETKAKLAVVEAEVARLAQDRDKRESEFAEYKAKKEEELNALKEQLFGVTNLKQYFETEFNKGQDELRNMQTGMEQRAGLREKKNAEDQKTREEFVKNLQADYKEKIDAAQKKVDEVEKRLKLIKSKRAAREEKRRRKDEADFQLRKEQRQAQRVLFERELQEETERLKQREAEKHEQENVVSQKEFETKKRLEDRELERIRRQQEREDRLEAARLAREDRKAQQAAMLEVMSNSLTVNLKSAQESEANLRQAELDEMKHQRELLSRQASLKKEELAATLQREELDAGLEETIRRGDLDALKKATKERVEKNKKKESKRPVGAWKPTGYA